ncbi:hypothetical protein JCM3770_006771 [Rhodotorula araucariae]
MAYPHADPRSLPLPALPTSPALPPPPPGRAVEHLRCHALRQLSTYATLSSHVGTPPLEYIPGQPSADARRSPAEEEKDADLARSASLDSYGSRSPNAHWADTPVFCASPPVAVVGRATPVPLMLPPQAVFVRERSSPRTPTSLKQAMAFGDVGSVRDEKVGGCGAADVYQAGVDDWERFSYMVREGGQESEWLKREKSVAKKWWVLGWCGSICVIVAILVGLVMHFKGPSDDTMPAVPNIGGAVLLYSL